MTAEQGPPRASAVIDRRYNFSNYATTPPPLPLTGQPGVVGWPLPTMIPIVLLANAGATGIDIPLWLTAPFALLLLLIAVMPSLRRA